MNAKRIAAIDIGTVTCRLLIADASDAGLTEIRREVAIVNLGEGVDASGMLQEDAIERTAAQIERYRDIVAECAREYGGDIDTIAIATSAARDAKNADAFARKLADLGITLSVISGDREAGLSFLGASSSFPGETLLVVDIGGGSTELIAGKTGSLPLYRHSFDVGCRRMTEKFFAADPPTAEEMARAKEWATSLFEEGFEAIGEAGIGFTRMVAVAGTATSVVSVGKGMAEYDPWQVHKTVVDRAMFDEVHCRLGGVPLAERKRIIGLEPKRAGVIVAGMVIMDAVLDLAGKSSFTVSETDILQGIIIDHAVQ